LRDPGGLGPCEEIGQLRQHPAMGGCRGHRYSIVDEGHAKVK
jgi:hypothetical protein